MMRLLARGFLRLNGWEPEGSKPAARRYVLIAAPHTSNWDLAYLLALATVLDVKISFVAKHSLFRGPMGAIMRLLCGIPVDRAQPGGGVVEEMGARFKTSDHLLLAIAPEGTRGEVTRWKTGFHGIARAAGVPILAIALDYGRRQIRFRELFTPSPDLEADVEELQEFFADSLGRR